MTLQEKTEFLHFLNTQCRPDETLLDASFRILCFQQHKDKPAKKYFHTDQQFEQALFESNLVIPSMGIKIQFNEPIQKLIEAINAE